MSIFDAERQSLGMQPRSKTALPEKSIFADERAALASNGVKTYDYVETSPQDDSSSSSQYNQDNADYANAMRSAYQSNPQAFEPTKQPNLIQQYLNPDLLSKGVNAFTSNMFGKFGQDQPDIVQYTLGKTAEQAVPNAPDIQHPSSFSDFLEGLRTGNVVQPGTNARQEYAQMNPVQSTGNPSFDAVGNQIAGLAAPLVATYGTGAGAIPGLVESGLSRLGLNAGEGLLSKIGVGTAQGAAEGAALNAAGTAATEEPTLSNVSRSALEGSLLGGALGGGIPALGALGDRTMSNFARSAQEPSIFDQERAQLANGGPQNSIFADERARLAQNDQPMTTAEQSPIETAATSEEPQKSNWFTRLFGDSQGIGFSPFGSTKSNRMVSTEQQIVNNPLKSSIEGIGQNIKEGGKTTLQTMFDYLSPLKNISPETYNAAMDAARANNIANTIIRDKFVNNEGKVIGNSLDDIMKQAGQAGKALDDYLILRHAETRMGRGERVYDESLGMTPEKAKEAYQKLEQRYPQLKKAGEMWDQYTTNLLDSGVREGLISKEARDAMRDQNPSYAPMRRQFSTIERLKQPRMQGGSAFSGQSAPIKEVSPTGSTRKIVSPIRSMIEQTYAWKNAELRNRTMQEIVKAIQSDPEAMKGVAEIVKKPSTSYSNLDKALREGGSESFLEQLDHDYKSLFKLAKPGDETIVRAMVKGQPVYVKVHNPEAVKALIGMGSEPSSIVMKAMQKLSNWTKRGATGLLAPMFSVKNLTADTIQAAIQSPNAIKHLTVDLPAAFISSVGETLHIPGLGKLAEEFKRAGGEYSALLRGDKAVNNAVFNMRRYAPLSPQGIVKGAIGAAKLPFQALEKVADISENVNRMAAYRREIMGKERTPENVRNAINAARESTVNFSRRGSMGRETEAFVPYSNAALQGMYRIAKSFATPKSALKAAAGIGTLVVLPKLYEYARFNNDPDYQQLPAREKYRNLIVNKNADGTFTKIPLPPEYGALGGLINSVLDDVVNKDPNAYKGTLDALANAWTPPIVSGALQGATQGGGIDQSIQGLFNATTIAPAVALAGNQSFTGAPIVPKSLQGRSPQYQYDEKTSEIAKQIGSALNFSPMKVDYLLRAYGGDPARLLLPLNSQVGGANVRNTLLKNFIVDPTFTNNLTNDFYNAKQNIENAHNDNKQVGAPLPSWYSDDLYKTMTSQAKGSVLKQLSDLSDQKKQINANNNLSADDKANKLRDIQKQINNVYLDVNSKLMKSGVPLR